ncbi:MAG: HAD family phosphatase [Simkaniaceae bacterium]|nr:HAD family phosphatase [Simkaniaceae bacterium]
MKSIGNYNLFLFDFDGLLVNTEELHKVAYEEMLKRRGFTLAWNFATYATYAHKSTEALSNAVYDALPGLESDEPEWNVLRQEKVAIYSDLIDQKIALMPGVKEFLEKIKDKKKVVVTNSPKDQVMKIQEKIPELSVIDAWVTRDDYTNAKPAPDGYLHALTLFPHQKPIGFEDTEKGLNSLEAAGIEAVFIRPPNYPKTHTCKNTFSSFIDLLQSQDN